MGVLASQWKMHESHEAWAANSGRWEQFGQRMAEWFSGARSGLNACKFAPLYLQRLQGREYPCWT